MAEPNVVSVTSDDFRKPKEAEAINLNLTMHPNILTLAVAVPSDLNTRDYQVGDELAFEVVGITRKVIEGVQVK